MHFAPMLMYKNLLYTAVTRAKDMVIMVGREEALNRMVNNSDTQKRNTFLTERMKKIGELNL